MLWQGRLFALCEAGLPFEIDRASLATLGDRDLGAITGAFSAHPHDVPARRAFYNFGIENGLRARLAAYELPYAGRARKIAEVTIPGPTMVHDFVVTPRHVVFSVAPMRMRLGPLLLRRVGAMTAMEWRAERGSELIVVPIDDPGATFRVQVDAHYMEHVANAFEEGSTLTFDFIRYPDARGLEDFVGRLAHGTIGAPLQSSICRAVIDLAARRARFEPLLVAPCELPRVSPRVDAARHRFVYAAGFSSVVTARESFFDAVLKLDTEGGTVDRWALPDGHLCSEALFVPRRSPVSEDDGALLTMAFDPASDRSYLAVLDARAPAAPPRAKVWFDHAIPPGFHGIFAAR